MRKPLRTASAIRSFAPVLRAIPAAGRAKAIAMLRIRFPPAASRVEPASDGRWLLCRLRRFPRSGRRNVSPPDSPSRRFRPIFDMMQRLDLTDNERAILITALRRLVNFDPLSPQTQALKAILERLEPQKPQPIPDTAGTG